MVALCGVVVVGAAPAIVSKAALGDAGGVAFSTIRFVAEGGGANDLGGPPEGVAFKGGANVATAMGGAPGVKLVAACGGVDMESVERGGAMGET